MSDLQQQSQGEFAATVIGEGVPDEEGRVWVLMSGEHPECEGEEYACTYQGETRYGACYEFFGDCDKQEFWFKDFDGHECQRGETVTLTPNWQQVTP